MWFILQYEEKMIYFVGQLIHTVAQVRITNYPRLYKVQMINDSFK